MSDTNSRQVGGPPKRPAKASASSLLKKNRPQPSFAAIDPEPAVEGAAQPSEAAPSVPSFDEPIAPAAFLDRPTPSVLPAPTEAPEVAPPQPVHQVITSSPEIAEKPAAPTSPVGEQEDPLVNTTFRTRRSVKQAFNAAFLAAKLHEGWPTAEALWQELLERETKRIEDAYNNGQPFPFREQRLPRGRAIGS